MSIKFKKVEQLNSSPSKYLAPAGTHIARCYRMIHVGERDYEYQGEPKKKNSLWVYFELPNELNVFNPELGEQPYSVNIEYNHVPYETAKIMKHINSWRGKALSPQEIDDFDVSTLLEQPCMLTIVHNTSAANGKTYSNIASISGMPKGIECPKQVNPTYTFDYNDNFDMIGMDKNIPQFLQDIMKQTPEWNEKMNEIPNALEPSKTTSVMPEDLEDLNPPNKSNDLPF